MQTRTNGSGAHGGEDKQVDKYALSIETANGSCWRTLQWYVKRTQADVLCLQEHRISDPKKIAAASRWCRNNGWKSVWSTANPSDAGGEASGGTAILCRAKHLGLAPAEDLLEPTARTVGAKLDFPGGRRLLVVAAYLQCTIGSKDQNLKVLESIAEAKRAWKGPMVAGGDFNDIPASMIAAGVQESMSVKVVAPDTALGTCRTAKSARTIDYFLVSNDIACGIENVATKPSLRLAPHTPVRLDFLPNLTSLCKLQLQKP